MRTMCAACRKSCEVKLVDDGIGPYEFWGMKGSDVRMVTVSDCCEYDLLHEDGSPLSDSEVWDLCEPPEQEREYEPEDGYDYPEPADAYLHCVEPETDEGGAR